MQRDISMYAHIDTVSVRRKLTARRRGLKYKNASYRNKSRLSALIIMTESHPICNFPTWEIGLRQYGEILKLRGYYLNLKPHERNEENCCRGKILPTLQQMKPQIKSNSTWTSISITLLKNNRRKNNSKGRREVRSTQ